MPSALQHVDRDFAFVVAGDVEAAAVTGAVKRSRYRSLIGPVKVFDEYAGPKAETQFGKGLKSLAFTVRLQPKDAAFKDAELESICADIAAQVEKATGGKLRS